MNRLVVVLFGVLAGASFARAEDLPDHARPRIRYEAVPIIALRGTRLNVRYFPATPTAVAQFKGRLDLQLTVEGNLCLSSAKTYGVFPRRLSKTTILSLMAGAPLPIPPNMACAQYSHEVDSLVTQELDIPVFPNRPVDENFDLEIGYRGERVRLHLFARGEKLLIETIPLKPAPAIRR